VARANAPARRAKGPRPRHVPQRTCVGCRETAAKRGFVRIVRTPEGAVEVDETGKRAGRGAYLHRSPRCWEVGVNRRALDHALKVTLSPADRAALLEMAKDFPPDAEAPDEEAPGAAESGTT
jgi:predicted RNA-binding protein YlxR (DUF448 family)